MPAGLRDIEQDETGSTKKDVINDYYVRLLSVANTVMKDNKDASMNNHRLSAQRTFYELYLHLKDVVYGKTGFMASKFAKRNVTNGTRNVLVSMDSEVDNVRSKRTQHFNDTGVGVFQTIKGTLPLFKYHLKQTIGHMLGMVDGGNYAVDSKTYRRITVILNSDTVTKWTTSEGIEKIINTFFNRDYRHREIKLDDNYLGLMYNDGKSYKLFWDIDELPEHMNAEYVQPVTYMELFYIVLCKYIDKVRGWVTRFPIGQGKRSMYPTLFYLHSTTVANELIGLNDQWEKDDSLTLYEFPIRGETFMDGLIPHSSRIEGLVAD